MKLGKGRMAASQIENAVCKLPIIHRHKNVIKSQDDERLLHDDDDDVLK